MKIISLKLFIELRNPKHFNFLYTLSDGENNLSYLYYFATISTYIYFLQPHYTRLV